LSFFINELGHGYPENTTIIIGNCVDAIDRENAEKCNDYPFEIHDKSDLTPPIDSLFTQLDDEIDLFPRNKKTKLTTDFTKTKIPCRDFLQ